MPKKPDDRLRVRPNDPGSGPGITNTGGAFKYQGPVRVPLDGKSLLAKGMATKSIADDSEIELPGIWEVIGVEEAVGQKWLLFNHLTLANGLIRRSRNSFFCVRCISFSLPFHFSLGSVRA